MYKRILAVALAMAMILGLAGVALAASPFPDTEGIPEEVDVALLKTLGLVKGDDLGNFNPDDSITRAEFCAMIVRALGLENAASYLATPTQFPDVGPNAAWAYGYINVAVTKGVIKGYPDGSFKPSDPVSEAEALTMIMRALGYKDSLPGNWPLNYIIEGAKDTVGLVKAGFIPNVSATRAFVAGMMATMLDCKPVTEPDPDKNPGTFTPATATFKEGVLGVETGPDGLVTAVDKTNSKITIGGEPYDYDSSVVVSGKVSAVGDLPGYKVTTVIKATGGKIIFIATSVKDYISGKVTAVDVVNGTLTVAGTVYTADSTEFHATKNAEALEGSVANKLVALVNTTANVWLNNNGKVYRVEARYLDQAGKVIANKSVETTASGAVYKLSFDGTTYIPLDSAVTISRNGVAADWAALKVEDNCDYALVSGKIVWLDAWNQVVEKALVTAKYQLGSTTKQIVATVGGESVTYTCTDAGYTAVATVNTYWDLYLDRDGKVYAAVDKSSAIGKVSGIIAGTSIRTTVENSTTKVVYEVTLSDGTSLIVPLAADYNLKKNNTTVTITDPAATLVNDFVVGDGISADKSVAGTVSAVRLYSKAFKGMAAYDSTNGLKVTPSGGTQSDRIDITFAAPVTLNGVAAALESINGKIVTVTWDPATGKAIKVQGVLFAYDAASAVKQITSDSDGDYSFVLVSGHTASMDSEAIVVKDGVASTLSAIVLGDKVKYASNGFYIEVESDETKPALDGSVTAIWDGVDKYTVTIKFKEEVQPPTVWIAGDKVVFTSDETSDYITWEWESGEEDSKPGSISVVITAKDFAGNEFISSPLTVEVEDVTP